MNLLFNIITLSEIIYSNNVGMINFPTKEGRMGVLPNHMPLITKLNFGLVEVFSEDNIIIDQFVINGGLLEINDNKVNGLIDYVINLDSFDTQTLENKINTLSKNKNLDNKELEFYKNVQQYQNLFIKP